MALCDVIQSLTLVSGQIKNQKRASARKMATSHVSQCFVNKPEILVIQEFQLGRHTRENEVIKILDKDFKKKFSISNS